MKNKARHLSVILTLAMVVSLIPAVTLSATAAELTVVNSGIYTNGNPVIIAAGSSGTLIYYDADADGEIDVGEAPMDLSGPLGDSTSGYALGSYDIYGTALNTSVASSKITMLGGTVSYLFGSGPASGVNVTGNTDITFTGGTAFMLYGGGNYGSVSGSANVTVTGGTVSSIVGGCGAGTVSGSTNVTITGGTINGNVYGGGYGGSVSGTATVTVGVDATITGTVTSGCAGGSATVGTGSKVIYEIAFYDASGGLKYTTGDYASQWVTSGETAAKPATDPSQTGKTFSGWKQVSDNSDYNFDAAVSAAVKLYPCWVSTDATLKAYSTTVKGQTVTSLGTPNGTLGSETAGSVTITAAQAADTSNTGSFITLFDKNNANADVKAVKYAAGASTANFAGDKEYANEAITNGDFFIVKVTAQDSTTLNYYRINVTFTSNVPTATATGGKFTLGGAGSVDLYSSATAATNDDGQTFTGATLSVTNVSNTTEYLTVAGSDIPLISGMSGTFSAGNYRINVTGTTTSVLLSGMALDETAMGALIDGIAYKNSAASVTAGNRVIKLSLVTDSGGNNYTSTVLSIKSTVIVGNILSPDVETMDISACSGGDVILIGAGRSVTLDGKSTALTNVQIICETGVTLTLKNVIIANTTFGYSPVTFTGENNHLVVTGENSLSAGAAAPGVDVSNAALRIRGTGSLTARCIATTVGYGGAGIGTIDGATYDINIESGNITAIAGATNTRGVKALYPSPGISAADISITGGTVTATGYYGGAGIGSDGSADGSSITISGGVVTATADKFSVGIGCTTSAGRSDDKITISGGRVIATCLPYTTYNGISYALGTGIGNSFRSYDGTGGTIELTGGEIFAGFALPSGCTAGGYDIGDASILQSTTNWTVSIGGSAKVFLFNNRISGLTTSTHINKTYDAGTAEVYAVTIPEAWQSAGFGAYLRPCTLSYDVNGGSGTVPDPATRLYGTELALSDGSGLSRANYQFGGWNTAADRSGASYAAGGSYTMEEDTTLYAAWVGNTYAVTYDPSGGTVDPASQAKLYGSTYGKASDETTDAAMPTPTLAGHTFSGWYTAASGGTKINDSDTVSITENTTFYAQWTTNTYTVTYDPSGGSVDPASQAKLYGSTYSKAADGTTDTPMPTPALAGHTFSGWYTAASGGTKINDSDTVSITENTTYYAQWTTNTYTVTYDPNGGSVDPASQAKLYGSTYSKAADGTTDAPMPTPALAGHTFSGWYTAASGGTKITDSDTVSITENTTFYAQWTTNTYTVTYDPNGGSVDPASQAKLYGSTYSKAADGTTDAPMPTPTLAGHTFSGWYTAASGGTKITDSDTVGITENATLYAQWTVNQYTVTFSTDGGSFVSSISQDYNSKIDISPSSTKSGYIFVGWYADEALTNKIVFSYTIMASATLYAKWAVKDSSDSDFKTITVSETNSGLFSDSEGTVKAEADINNAFSSSVEVKVTDTDEKTSGFGFGTGADIYPFDISLYIKGTNTKTEPKDGFAVTISLPVPCKLLDVKEQLSIVHKSDAGTVTTLKSQLKQINGVWYLVFEATEFSPYALVVSNTGTYDEAAGLPYYVDSNGTAVFIGFAANGKYIAPSGATVLFKENTKSFADIGSHWAKNYIDFVTARELFTGTGENKFGPDTVMTRAMFATVIGRLYERSYGRIADTAWGVFTDVDYNSRYGKYVNWAADSGIITGIGGGLFAPDREITRQEMAAILYRFANFLGVLPSDMDTTLNYSDGGTLPGWAENAALYCQSTGIITGRDGGSFVPMGTVTRAEAATIIERFVESVMA